MSSDGAPSPPARTPNRRALRRLINAILINDTEIEAFCVDFFIDIKKLFGIGWGPEQKINLLLESQDPTVLLTALEDGYPDLVSQHSALLSSTKPTNERISDYELIREIGRGGSATVHEARNIKTGSIWALKRMHSHVVLERPESRLRFVQEAQLCSSINNDHIVKVVTAGVDPAGVPWIVMDLLAGQDLGKYLESHPSGLASDEACAIIEQLCSGIAAAHARKIVHRDLKPENVFLANSSLSVGPRRIVKILDFGISKVIEESQFNHSVQITGTAPWMAPEQYDTRSPIDPATDVWALGLIAFSIFTGHHFFITADSKIPTTLTAMFKEVVVDPLPQASERAAQYGCSERLPQNFDTWIGKCLHRDRAQRYVDAEATRQAFVALIVSGRASVGTRPPLPTSDTAASSETRHAPAGSPVTALSPAGAPASLAVPPAKSAASARAQAHPLPKPPAEESGQPESAQTWREAVARLEQAAATAKEPSEEAGYRKRLARIVQTQLGHDDEAQAAWEAVLQLVPSDLDALRALAGLHRKHQRLPELAATLQRLVDSVRLPAAEAGWLRPELAGLYALHLNRPQDAIVQWQRVLAVTPLDPQARRTCEDLLVAGERWSDVAQLIADGARLLSAPQDVIRELHRLAVVQEVRLKDPAASERSLQQILRIDPADLRATEALERLYRAGGSWQPLAELLLNRAELQSTPAARRSELRHASAELYERKLRDPERAFSVLQLAFRQDPSNVQTMEAWENLARTTRRWPDVVAEYTQALPTQSDPAVQVRLCLRIANVQHVHLRQGDAATAALDQALQIAPTHEEALQCAASLFRELEQWDKLADVLRRLTTLPGDQKVRCERLLALAGCYEEKLGQFPKAIALYKNCLLLDPASPTVLTALYRLYGRMPGMWPVDDLIAVVGQLSVHLQSQAEQVQLINELSHHEAKLSSPSEQAKLRFKIGTLLAGLPRDGEGAAAWYASALALSPDHLGALQSLSDLYVHQKTWKEAEPLLDRLLRLKDSLSKNELGRLYYKIAKTSEELGQPERALDFYNRAYDSGDTSPPVCLGWANMLYQASKPGAAAVLYERLLNHHREALDKSALATTYYRLGAIRQGQNRGSEAVGLFVKVLELDAQHAPSLTGIVELESARGNWSAVVEAKRALREGAPPDLKFQLSCEMAECYVDKLERPADAIACYSVASELKPENSLILHKLLDLHTKQEQWLLSVAMLHRIAALEPDPLRRGKFFYTAGVIKRDAIKNGEAALAEFNQALDTYFSQPQRIPRDQLKTYLKPFEAIVQLCGKRKDAQGTSEQYRRMLMRLAPYGQDPLITAMLISLGEVYRDQLGDIPAAIQCFELAIAADPDHRSRREGLAQLYLKAGPDYLDKAIAEQRYLISLDPTLAEPYHNLYTLFLKTHAYDQAWCVLVVLTHRNQATPQQARFYAQHRRRHILINKARLSEEMWAKHLYHPSQDPRISSLFSTIYMGVGMLKSAEHRRFNLRRKDRRDVASDGGIFSKVFAYAMQVLTVPPNIEIYFRPDSPGSLELANCREKQEFLPSVVVGGGMLSVASEPDLAYASARFLTLLRPEHYLRIILPSLTERITAAVAGMRMVAPSYPIPEGYAASVEQLIPALSPLLPWEAVLVLQQTAHRIIADGQPLDLAKWSQAAELTAHRAALLLAPDLGLAHRSITQADDMTSAMSVEQKMQQLGLYVISPSFFALRSELGMTIS